MTVAVLDSGDCIILDNAAVVKAAAEVPEHQLLLA